MIFTTGLQLDISVQQQVFVLWRRVLSTRIGTRGSELVYRVRLDRRIGRGDCKLATAHQTPAFVVDLSFFLPALSSAFRHFGSPQAPLSRPTIVRTLKSRGNRNPPNCFWRLITVQGYAQDRGSTRYKQARELQVMRRGAL